MRNERVSIFVILLGCTLTIGSGIVFGFGEVACPHREALDEVLAWTFCDKGTTFHSFHPMRVIALTAVGLGIVALGVWLLKREQAQTRVNRDFLE